jgi:hypothetical protein
MRYLIGAIMILLFTASTVTGIGPDDVDAVKAAKVKAAYLYNFTKFTRWPDERFESEDSPIVIGVVGKDPFGSILESTVRDKTVGGRRIVIRRDRDPRRDDAIDPDFDPRACHLIFVAESEKSRFKTIAADAAKHDVLAVGDHEDFAERGGMIELALEGGKITMHVNLDAVERSDLSLSSKLLKLATIYREPNGGPGR